MSLLPEMRCQRCGLRCPRCQRDDDPALELARRVSSDADESLEPTRLYTDEEFALMFPTTKREP